MKLKAVLSIQYSLQMPLAGLCEILQTGFVTKCGINDFRVLSLITVLFYLLYSNLEFWSPPLASDIPFFLFLISNFMALDSI